MTQTIKAGTRIEVFGADHLGQRRSEAATIARWMKRNGAIKNHVSPTNGGWHIVQYEDGGKLCVHESGFRVTDNRAA